MTAASVPAHRRHDISDRVWENLGTIVKKVDFGNKTNAGLS